MAGIARNAICVICRNYLRKTSRLGAIGFMTAGAENRCVKLRGFNRPGIVSMVGRGPMAGFASHHHVLALFFQVCDIAVAGLTSLVAGKGNGAGSDFA